MGGIPGRAPTWHFLHPHVVPKALPQKPRVPQKAIQNSFPEANTSRHSLRIKEPLEIKLSIGNGEWWGGHRGSQTLRPEGGREKKLTFIKSLLSTVYFARFFKCLIRGKYFNYIYLPRPRTHAMASKANPSA